MCISVLDFTGLSLNTPSGVTGRFINGTAAFIISWDYQPNVQYYHVFLKEYYKGKGVILWVNSTLSGVFQPNCSSNKPICSHCYYNINSTSAACGSEYKVLTGTELDRLIYDSVVKIRVGVCTNGNTSSCSLNSDWKAVPVPPGGTLHTINHHLCK